MAAIVALAGCARNPASGARQLMLVDEPLEIESGRAADGEVTARIGLVDDPALQSYVTDLGVRLAASSERPGLPWQFRVLDDPGLNAFALPGGFVYVTRGLLAHLDSDAELAAVLGHEIGHVTARHSVRRSSETRLFALGLGMGAFVEPRVAANLALVEAAFGLLALRLGRDDELEADRLGLRYLSRTRYESSAAVRVLRLLGRVEHDRDGRSLVAWLSTHPTSCERLRRLRAASGGGRAARREYLRRIDGLVFGDDPRAGFFRGGVFVQPLLDLRITLPRGWRTRLEKTGAVAISPGGEAALVAGPAASPSAWLAAQAFTSSARLQVTPARREGSCWMREFRHFAADGTGYRGLACFSERSARRVLKVVAYAEAEVFERERATLLSSIGSIGPADGAPRSPQRVQVLDAGPLEIAEFQRAYPSVVPQRTIALINGLDPDDAHAVMPQPAKRVVSGSRE